MGLGVALLAILALASEPQTSLVVHEWGTFTCLQDERGDAIGGVNSDEEPLPQFVHRLAWNLIIGERVQGAPKCHPDVTMRLETPVVYFHPHEGAALPITVDVLVKFRGGWLTQFYPDAEVDAPGLKTGDFQFGPLTGRTVGSLVWKGLRIGGTEIGPATLDRVWTTPRNVRATSVTTASGETERFLFYRGVGRLDSPLRVERGPDEQLVFRSQIDPTLAGESARVAKIWFTEIRENAEAAFSTYGSWVLGKDRSVALAKAPAEFVGSAFDSKNLARLRDEMRSAVIDEGLFADEADALLDTWELSYFKSPGLRVFFIVPQAWTDRVLPITVSVPHEIKRVMVGRIELMTPQRRELARQIIALEKTATDHAPLAQRDELKRKLGRFADAIILDTQE